MLPKVTEACAVGQPPQIPGTYVASSKGWTMFNKFEVHSYPANVTQIKTNRTLHDVTLWWCHDNSIWRCTQMGFIHPHQGRRIQLGDGTRFRDGLYVIVSNHGDHHTVQHYMLGSGYTVPVSTATRVQMQKIGPGEWKIATSMVGLCLDEWEIECTGFCSGPPPCSLSITQQQDTVGGSYDSWNGCFVKSIHTPVMALNLWWRRSCKGLPEATGMVKIYYPDQFEIAPWMRPQPRQPKLILPFTVAPKYRRQRRGLNPSTTPDYYTNEDYSGSGGWEINDEWEYIPPTVKPTTPSVEFIQKVTTPRQDKLTTVLSRNKRGVNIASSGNSWKAEIDEIRKQKWQKCYFSGKLRIKGTDYEEIDTCPKPLIGPLSGFIPTGVTKTLKTGVTWTTAVVKIDLQQWVDILNSTCKDTLIGKHWIKVIQRLLREYQKTGVTFNLPQVQSLPNWETKNKDNPGHHIPKSRRKRIRRGLGEALGLGNFADNRWKDLQIAGLGVEQQKLMGLTREATFEAWNALKGISNELIKWEEDMVATLRQLLLQIKGTNTTLCSAMGPLMATNIQQIMFALQHGNLPEMSYSNPVLKEIAKQYNGQMLGVPVETTGNNLGIMLSLPTGGENIGRAVAVYDMGVRHNRTLYLDPNARWIHNHTEKSNPKGWVTIVDLSKCVETTGTIYCNEHGFRDRKFTKGPSELVQHLAGNTWCLNSGTWSSLKNETLYVSGRNCSFSLTSRRRPVCFHLNSTAQWRGHVLPFVSNSQEAPNTEIWEGLIEEAIREHNKVQDILTKLEQQHQNWKQNTDNALQNMKDAIDSMDNNMLTFRYEYTQYGLFIVCLLAFLFAVIFGWLCGVTVRLREVFTILSVKIHALKSQAHQLAMLRGLRDPETGEQDRQAPAYREPPTYQEWARRRGGRPPIVTFLIDRETGERHDGQIFQPIRNRSNQVHRPQPPRPTAPNPDNQRPIREPRPEEPEHGDFLQGASWMWQ